MEILLLLLFTVFLDSGARNEFEVDSYMNLISENTANATVYEMPENNSKFATEDESKINDFGSFDFIVVGAGSSGSVLASRLSEISDWKILVLEAGGEENTFSSIISMYFPLQFSEKNWGYHSTSQTNCCLGMNDRKCMLPRGKSIGGSSAINAAIYARGNRRDYDKWGELGNPGWSYEEVLPYFMKSENFRIDGDDGYHGRGGFWNVEYSEPAANIFEAFMGGNSELNMSYVDYNGRQQIGVSRVQSNLKNGRRHSTGTAFLKRARERKNVKIVTEALVTKIILDVENRTATGVLFIQNNTKFSVTATKEVIVSCGAFNSPQLLMLSGIGPKNHLQQMGINVIEDLPVGDNLMEQPMFFGLTFRTNCTTPTLDMRQALSQYVNGFGPLTNIIEGIGFVHPENTLQNVPKIEYLFYSAAGFRSPLLARARNYNKEIENNYINKINSSTDIFFQVVLLHPKSKGRITLKSKDPIDFPNIDINMLSEPEDIANMIEGVEFVLKLAQTEAFKKINATLLDLPICGNFEKYSKKFWKCVLPYMTFSNFHPCGTTTMGFNRSLSVVDAYLKVHGIGQLRVVDAGVFPASISGHTNAPAVMIAEKISDVIKNNYL